MRLAIGAAQMGMPYGIANRTGQVGPAEIVRVLDLARQRGVDTIDTAAAYGDSERALGDAGVADLRVVTKVPAVPDQEADPGAWVERSVRDSRARLRIDRLHAVLLHRSSDLEGARGAAVAESLERVRREGLAERVGISVYSPEELQRATNRLDIGLVQLPRNPLDRRFERSGWIARLHRSGVEVHVRSTLLQGLLALPADRVPARFARWNGHLTAWRRWLDDQGVSALQACIGDALDDPCVDRVVLGVDRAEQLAEACDAAQRRPARVPDRLAVDDLDLLLPSRWGPS